MEKRTKVLKILLFIAILCLAFLFFNQSPVKATEANTIEELKAILGEKGIISGNTIKLTDNIVLKDEVLDIKVPEIILDFNGKKIECRENGYIKIHNKATFKDTSTKNRLDFGGVVFNRDNGESINVCSNAELIIDNGKFIDVGAKTSWNVYVSGKMKINDATFSTNRTKPEGQLHNMIFLGPDSECIINNGEFSSMDSIITIGGSQYINDSIYTGDRHYSNKCKLTINGGSFNCLNSDAIDIKVFYPYVDADGNKEIITPKITLNNCNINAKHTAIGFWGGCTDVEFKDADTKILTILGGTYTSSKESYGSTFEIRTYANPNTYFNPKDFVLQGCTFESLNDSIGAMRLLGPNKRRIQNNL